MKGQIKVSPKAQIHWSADIEISKKGSSFIVGNSNIDAFVKIKFTGGNGDIIIGDGVYINSGTVIYSGNGVRINDNVLIGPNCNIVATGHNYAELDKLIKDQGHKFGNGIIINEDVWIGAGVTILDNVVIAKGCVIGAGSLIRHSLLVENEIWAGSPIKSFGKRGR